MNDLRQNINKYFNEQELQNLCFDLDIDYDNLGGNVKAGKIRELLAFVKRRGLTTKLLKQLDKERPHVTWEDLFFTESSLEDDASESAIPSKVDSIDSIVRVNPAPLPSSWVTQFFSDSALDAYMTYLRTKITFLHEPVAIGGGLSGARTLSVHVAPENELIPQGHYILKICQSDHARKEIKEHRVAENNSTLGKHVPHIALALEDPTDTLAGIFYQVAGNSLLTAATLQDVLTTENRTSTQLHEIAHVLLTYSVPKKNINGKQENILQVIKSGLEKYRLDDLRERLTSIVSNPLCARLEGFPLSDNEWKSNPLPYLLNEFSIAFPQKQFLFRGRIHGDLHPANIIVPVTRNKHITLDSSTPFWLIDFALAREGNALYDLAYLELSLLLTLVEGRTKKELQGWWALERYLSHSLDARHGPYTGFINKGIIEPLRDALVQRANKDGMLDSYQVTFLAASVEAGLNFARKLKNDPHRQRIAFLTAVSRFDRLLELLSVTKHKGHMGVLLPLESTEPPPEETSKRQAGVGKSGLLPLVWPAAVSRYKNLFDPHRLVERIVNKLLSEEGQGVLLLGERISGKSSFLNGVRDYISSQIPYPVLDLYIGTQNLPDTVNSLAKTIISGICRQKDISLNNIGLYSDHKEEIFYDIGHAVDICCSLVPPHSNTKAILFIDEVDSMIKECEPGEADRMLGLIARLSTDPALQAFRVFLTASDSSILKRGQFRSKLLSSIKNHTILNLSQDEMNSFINKLDTPLSFSNEALQQIYKYTSGSYYLTKFMLRIIAKHPHVQAGNYDINPQVVEEAVAIVIKANLNDYEYQDLHNDLFDTLEDVYKIHFSENERQFAEHLASSEGGTTPDSQTDRDGAESLHKRGYLLKVHENGKPIYNWKIGLWKAFLIQQYGLRVDQNLYGQPLLDINTEKGLIRVNGSLLGPTKQQRQLLYYLGQHAGQLVTNDDLANHVWNDASGAVSDQAIAASISRLRKALAKLDPETTYIETVIGQGYILHHARYYK